MQIPEVQLTDFEAHLARIDGMLLALEDVIAPPEEGQARFTSEDIPPPLEELPEPPTDRLTTLIRQFNLNRVEADLLRMAVAVELSPSIADTFARLQGDRRLRRPQIALALRLIEPEPTVRNALIPLLHQASPLRFHRLIELSPPWRDRQPLFTELEIALPAVLLQHLAGARAVDPDYALALSLIQPQARMEALSLPDDTRAALTALSALGAGDPGASGHIGPRGAERLLLYLSGAYGTGKRSAAEVLARAWGLSVMQIDLRKMTDEDLRDTPVLRIALRDARRLSAVPLFLHAERLSDKEGGEDGRRPDPMRLERFLVTLEDFPGPVILSGAKPVAADARWSRRQPIALRFTPPTTDAEREGLWWRALSSTPGEIERDTVHMLSMQFHFSPGQIRDAVSAARGLAAARDPNHPLIDDADLRAGCLAQLRHDLESLSRKSRTLFGWDDLILPEETKRQLRMFESFIRNQEKVYEEWGMGRKLSTGRGLKALFYGASGTGKTMAATVIAATLGIDLFKVDLSTLVSKWVGETEKNLDRIFTEAEKSHAIILFDEADSLFGKRGSVEKGTDRYSNMEVNYLLQRFEEYDGVVILTSNFPRGIDDAFSRRMHFMINFPTPEEEMRLKLWKSMIPPELPLDEEVDLERLATQFDLSGGNIKNIVLGASFIAAENQQPVTMLDLMRAIQWEYQKIGRTSSRSEFQEFFDQLQ